MNKYQKSTEALLTVVKTLLWVILGLLLIIGYLVHIASPVLW